MITWICHIAYKVCFCFESGYDIFRFEKISSRKINNTWIPLRFTCIYMLTSLLLLIVFISVLVFYRPLACKRPTQLFILDIINIVYIYVCYLALSSLCLALQAVFSRIIMCRYFSDKHYVACSCPEILWQLIFCTVFTNITYYINNGTL